MKSVPSLLQVLRLSLVAAVSALLLVSCGGGSSNSSSTTSAAATSKIAQRVFVSNQQSNVLQIVDAKQDLLSTFTVQTGLAPIFLVESTAKDVTLVFNSGSNSVGIVDNATEAMTAQIALPDFTESLAISPDGHTAYASVRNAAAVEVLDLVNKVISNTLAVPGVRRVVLSHNGSRLLAFNDVLPNSFSVIDTTNLAAGAVTVTAAGLDHPFTAVFSQDDSTAYILSCGAECGGAAASVTGFTISGNVIGASVAVPGATVGLLNNGSLFVAGNTVASFISGSGQLSVIDPASMTLSKPAIAITDGIHNLMSMGSNGQLFVGSHACSGANNTGCLSIYNSSSGAVSTDPPRGDVARLHPAHQHRERQPEAVGDLLDEQVLLINGDVFCHVQREPGRGRTRPRECTGSTRSVARP